tara:strand:- start:177 stop:458 length:282 start_codon:yes stop_codon:yes gene_type:complete
MAIPKKFKKQLKADMRQSSKISYKKPKMEWSFNTGDLVEFKNRTSYESAMIIEDRGDGWYLLMGPGGKTWKKATKMKKIQKAQANGPACKTKS